jgi:hypothetical protein
MKRFLVVLTFLILGVGSFFAINELIKRNLSVEDSDALLGGELERGYPSAGYLISNEPGGGLKTCGYAILNSRVAVTASHCVDNSQSIFLGLGDFSLSRSRHIEVQQATQKEQWIRNKERAHDFAILNINGGSFYSDFAEVASPTEGCKYRVVAYGRTEDPNESFTKPRKSAKLCATEITGNTFIINGDGTSGICFGDSGSPVYYEDTNKLVGVVVSIILADPDETDPCSFGNTAIVVRTDANQSLINNNIQGLDSSLGSINVVDGLTIEVAEQSFLDKLGLGYLERLPAETRMKYILYLAGTLLVFVVLVLLFVLTRRPKQSQQYWE